VAVFVLLSQQRSGTAALTSFISSHPEIHNLSEVLNPYGWNDAENFFHYWLTQDPSALIRSVKSPSELFADFISAKEKEYNGQRLLMDIKLNSIRHVLNYWEEPGGFTDTGMPWLINLFFRRNYPIIYLDRTNHFSRYVSAKVAELTGIYHSNEKSVRITPVELDVQAMLAYIESSLKNAEFISRCLSKFNKVLYLEYNSVFKADRIVPAVKGEIAQFLGIDIKTDIEPYYVKQNPLRLSRVISNFKDVNAALENAGLGRFVEAA
jgi:hypothetical protein